jgi:uncharacterized protein with NRDE domain
VCVLFVAWRVREDVPLVVAANRDEAYARPSVPAHRWEDCPAVVGGRDGVARGTWLGAASGGRWAAVTNVRHPRWMTAEMPRSRGHLVSEFLCGDEPAAAYARRAYEEREAYGGFNLMLGDASHLMYVARDGDGPRSLAPGVYGLSNASLDDPWPKVASGGAAFRLWLAGDLDPGDGLQLLHDRSRPPDHLLPDTGVGLELERVLAPLFIVGEAYGTRASTLLTVRADGQAQLVERSFGPGGEPAGLEHLTFAMGERAA